jgi:hypothetical protein
MTSASLRQCVLMVSVLHGIDVIPRDDGVSLPPNPSVASSEELLVPWSTIESVLRDFSDVTDAVARKHLAHWFTTARGLGDLSLQEFLTYVTVIGMPHNAPAHPGSAWTHTEVLGGALHLGLGLRLLGHLSDETSALTPELMTVLGHDPARAWEAGWTYLNAMGQLAADRHGRDPVAVLRPMGDCDVVSLLGSPHFRACLAQFHNVGMRAVAVPMRTRGWVDPNHLDSAFVQGAAAATDRQQRGFTTAMLVTADGVWEAKPSENLVDFALRDAKQASNWIDQSRFRR